MKKKGKKKKKGLTNREGNEERTNLVSIAFVLCLLGTNEWRASLATYLPTGERKMKRKRE